MFLLGRERNIIIRPRERRERIHTRNTYNKYLYAIDQKSPSRTHNTIYYFIFFVGVKSHFINYYTKAVNNIRGKETVVILQYYILVRTYIIIIFAISFCARRRTYMYSHYMIIYM